MLVWTPLWATPEPSGLDKVMIQCTFIPRFLSSFRLWHTLQKTTKAGEEPGCKTVILPSPFHCEVMPVSVLPLLPPACASAPDPQYSTGGGDTIQSCDHVPLHPILNTLQEVGTSYNHVMVTPSHLYHWVPLSLIPGPRRRSETCPSPAWPENKARFCSG